MSNKFVIRKPDGSERNIASYEVSSPPPSAKNFKSSLKTLKLPPRVDLRPEMTEVESQGQTCSCTANAVAGAVEYLMKRQLGEEAYDVSRLFIYYNGRYLNPYNKNAIKDTGSAILYCIQGIKDYGVCSEDTWTFDPKIVNAEPDEDAYSEAEGFQIEDEEVLPTSLAAWKSALAEGYPIIFAVKTYKTFDAHRRPGLVPMPSTQEASRKDHGAHAMLCVGYSDKDQVFIVRNSWGSQWGDKGYCYMPYDYILSEKHNLGYNAIIKHAEPVAYDEDTWQDDEESLLGDYESELANMSDEDYEAMLEDMGDYPLEYRIAIIFIHVANADDDFSKAERKELFKYLKNTFEALGSEYDAKEVLDYTWNNDSEDEDLLEESVSLLGEYLSSEMLATIINDLKAIVSIDDESEEETDYIDYLIGEWQIEESEEEEYEEDEEEDEEEYEEGEEEYEEGEEEYEDEEEEYEDEEYEDEEEE
jgi:C1A family cysteine protease/uncharacterized tellurite resistance protein B-like protein